MNALQHETIDILRELSERVYERSDSEIKVIKTELEKILHKPLCDFTIGKVHIVELLPEDNT